MIVSSLFYLLSTIMILFLQFQVLVFTDDTESKAFSIHTCRRAHSIGAFFLLPQKSLHSETFPRLAGVPLVHTKKVSELLALRWICHSWFRFARKCGTCDAAEWATSSQSKGHCSILGAVFLCFSLFMGLLGQVTLRLAPCSTVSGAVVI